MRVALVLDGLTILVLVPDTFEFFILHINDHIAKQTMFSLDEFQQISLFQKQSSEVFYERRYS